MGVINAENLLKLRSSKELFDRIKKYLSSFDSQNLIDEGDFYDYIVECLEKLGVSVYRECEAVLEVRDHKTKLPCNFKVWYAAYKVHPEFGFVPSINEQRPWIWYQDNEITQDCDKIGNCKIECKKDDFGKIKVVVRTYVNGDEYMEYHHREPVKLFLSPNVKDPRVPHAERMIHSHWNEVTIDDEHYMHTKFREDCVYMQYYGLPFDENLLPMVPDETILEKAIEFYIYTQLFEKWYLNSTIPNIGDKLKYVKGEFENKHWPMALYFVKLPSFQRCIQSIKLMRSKNKFYQFNFDKTSVGSGYYGAQTGFPII